MTKRVYVPRRGNDPSYLKDRMRYLPAQIAATRHKLVALENEARRYGMLELIGGGE